MSKKRANGEGTIRQRSNGSWEARLSAPGNKRISVYGKTQKEVREKMTAMQAEIDTGVYTSPTTMTVSEWLDIWYNDFLKVSSGTKARYESDIRLHIKPAIGQHKLSTLTPHMIQRLYNTKESEGMSYKSIKNLHGTLHNALRTAVETGYLRINPCNACKLVTPPPPETHPVQDDDLPRFLAAIKGTRNEDLLYVITFTGMRISEAIGLTWDCIDFERGTIHLYRQWHKNRQTKRYEFGPLKNRKNRTIKPAQQVMDTLKHVRLQQNKWQLMSGGLWCNENHFVFTHPDGRSLKTDTVYGNLKRIVKSIGIGQTRVHDLRHTFATLSLQNGTDIKTVSTALGHATVAFTLDRYGHVSQTMQDDGAKRMKALIDAL